MARKPVHVHIRIEKMGDKFFVLVGEDAGAAMFYMSAINPGFVRRKNAATVVQHMASAYELDGAKVFVTLVGRGGKERKITATDVYHMTRRR